MNDRTVTLTTRIGLAVLAVSALPLGLWAVIAPRSYFDDFPGFGRHWISPDGPYNEHLMRDFGGLNLALGLFTICALVWLTRPLIVAVAIGWLAYSLPHVTYHAFNLERYDTTDKIGIIGGLLIAPVIAVVLLLTSRRLARS